MEGTIKALFAKRPRALALFRHVRSYISTLGGVKAEAAKTQVSFGALRKFAWVWLPQMWVNAPGEGIVLSFALPRQVNDPRIKQSVQPGPGRWMHHVVILKEEDLDDKVKKWILDAYEWGKVKK